MPVPNPRNRIVVFRLTQREYDHLKSASRRTGARNISEFARSEILLSVERSLDAAAAAGEPVPHVRRTLIEAQHAMGQLLKALEVQLQKQR